MASVDYDKRFDDHYYVNIQVHVHSYKLEYFIE